MDDPKNLVKDRILYPADNNSWIPENPDGSLYKTIRSLLRGYLEDHGDWILLKDELTEDTFMASAFEPAANK
jgi:hypothetical protein